MLLAAPFIFHHSGPQLTAFTKVCAWVMYTLAATPASNGILAQPSSGTAHIHRLSSIAYVQNCVIYVLKRCYACRLQQNAPKLDERRACCCYRSCTRIETSWLLVALPQLRRPRASGGLALLHEKSGAPRQRFERPGEQLPSRSYVTPCCLSLQLLTAAASRLCCSTCRPEASPRRCSSTCQAKAQHSC